MFKIIVIVFFMSLLLITLNGCSKVDFDPKTGMFRYILKQEKINGVDN
jgi:hypothetical protein|tara:strand:+ start:9879 stop:10022 length:144 start_codon:yes stop_codon:yes gene_type:complete